MKKFRIFIIFLISLIPTNTLRKLSYNFLFNYNIDSDSQIGWFTFINCSKFECINTEIKSLKVAKSVNIFLYCQKCFILCSYYVISLLKNETGNNCTAKETHFNCCESCSRYKYGGASISRAAISP